MFGEGEFDKEAAVIARIARQEEWAKQAERRLQIVEEHNMSFSKLASAVDMMQKLEEERQKRQEYVDQQQRLQTEKLSNTLDKMNVSFVQINESMHQIHITNKDIMHKVDIIETDVSGVKVSLNKANVKIDEMERDDTINWKKGIKRLGGIFLTVVVSGLATYVLIHFGFGK